MFEVLTSVLAIIVIGLNIATVEHALGLPAALLVVVYYGLIVAKTIGGSDAGQDDN